MFLTLNKALNGLGQIIIFKFYLKHNGLHLNGISGNVLPLFDLHNQSAVLF